MSSPAVKVDEETHHDIKKTKAQILIDTGDEKTYGEVVREAVAFFKKSQPWKKKEAVQ